MNIKQCKIEELNKRQNNIKTTNAKVVVTHPCTITPHNTISSPKIDPYFRLLLYLIIVCIGTIGTYLSLCTLHVLVSGVSKQTYEGVIQMCN